MKQVNNKWTTIVLGEETLRKLSRLDIQADDKEEVQRALKTFELERQYDEIDARKVVKL